MAPTFGVFLSMAMLLALELNMVPTVGVFLSLAMLQPELKWRPLLAFLYLSPCFSS